jgi:hypothetical protein
VSRTLVQRAAAIALVQSLNPLARIRPTLFADVPVSNLIVRILTSERNQLCRFMNCWMLWLLTMAHKQLAEY